MDDREAWLPLAQAALRLGISRERCLRLVTNRELRGEQRSGKWWVHLADLEQFLRRVESSPTP